LHIPIVGISVRDLKLRLLRVSEKGNVKRKKTVTFKKAAKKPKTFPTEIMKREREMLNLMSQS